MDVQGSHVSISLSKHDSPNWERSREEPMIGAVHGVRSSAPTKLPLSKQ